jgi:uncharacterized protein YqgC (DUF456 family)
LEHWMEVTIFWITQVVMLVGLFGLVVPIYPGTVIMWLGALGYGIVTGFTTLGIVLFVIISLLMLASTIADNLMMSIGARQGGASWWSIALALLAGVVGTLLLPPFGGIIAAPLVVLLVEFLRLNDLKKAWQALRGLATGWGLSFVVRFAIGAVMMILWYVWVWKG